MTKSVRSVVRKITTTLNAMLSLLRPVVLLLNHENTPLLSMEEKD